MEKASGDALNRWVALMGIKRRWFGLEPNFMLRKRMIRKMARRDTHATPAR